MCELILDKPLIFQAQITCHLQLICLIEHVRINSQEIADLVRIYGGDIRRCLLALQYWVVSGGGISCEQKSICKPKYAMAKMDNTYSQLSLDGNTMDGNNSSSGIPSDVIDGGSIQVLKSGRRRARMLVDDDSSNGMAVAPSSVSSESTQAIDHPSRDLPPLHTLILDSLVGSTNYVRQPLMESLQSSVSAISRKTRP